MIKTKKKEFPKYWGWIVTGLFMSSILFLLGMLSRYPTENIVVECPLYVDATVYRAVGSQTDDDPLETASGFVIDTNCQINLVGVSRDLLIDYPFGTIIKVMHPDINSRYGKYFVVLDVMNKRYTNTIDILVYDDYVNKWSNVYIERFR